MSRVSLHLTFKLALGPVISKFLLNTEGAEMKRKRQNKGKGYTAHTFSNIVSLSLSCIVGFRYSPNSKNHSKSQTYLKLTYLFTYVTVVTVVTVVTQKTFSITTFFLIKTFFQQKMYRKKKFHKKMFQHFCFTKIPFFYNKNCIKLFSPTRLFH